MHTFFLCGVNSAFLPLGFSEPLSIAAEMILENAVELSRAGVSLQSAGYDNGCHLSKFMTRRHLAPDVSVYIPAFHLRSHPEECARLYSPADALSGTGLLTRNGVSEHKFVRLNKLKGTSFQGGYENFMFEILAFKALENAEIMNIPIGWDS